jgi:hypothetical protein
MPPILECNLPLYLAHDLKAMDSARFYGIKYKPA